MQLADRAMQPAGQHGAGEMSALFDRSSAETDEEVSTQVARFVSVQAYAV